MKSSGAKSRVIEERDEVPIEEKEPVPVAVKEEYRPTATMACTARLGSHTCDGPITGQTYIISNTGTPGIDVEDAEIIAVETIKIRCQRTGGWIDIIPAGIMHFDDDLLN